MSKRSRRLLIGAGILAAAFLVLVACVALFVHVDRYKSSIESAVSETLGMEFKVRGKVSLGLLPRPRLTLADIHLSKGKTDILWADDLQASLRWIPFLLHQTLSIDGISLEHPTIRIEQSPQTSRTSQTSHGQVSDQDTTSRPGTMSRISVLRGDVTYVDRTSGRSVLAGNLDLRLTDISWHHSTALQPLTLLKSLGFHGTLHVATLQLGTFKASDLSCGIKNEAGLLQLDPTAIVLFGGTSRGSLTLDLTGSSPRIRLVQAASQIDLTQVFPVRIFSGTAQASLDVEGTGSDQQAITKTLKGRAAFRSEHITINSLNIDGLIADYNRTQNFSLIDLGALVIAGPFAPLVTKGVDFSRLAVFGRMGNGKSEIRRVVSDWTIVDGIAQTKDVAFTTPKNAVAFRGDFDFVNGRYVHFFVATVDQQGCAQVKREVSGPLGHPHVEGPGSASLGPFKTAFQNTKKLFQSQKCDLFYSGSAIQ